MNAALLVLFAVPLAGSVPIVIDSSQLTNMEERIAALEISAGAAVEPQSVPQRWPIFASDLSFSSHGCEDISAPPVWAAGLAGTYITHEKFVLDSGALDSDVHYNDYVEWLRSTSNPYMFTRTPTLPCDPSQTTDHCVDGHKTTDLPVACQLQYACTWSLICVDNDDVAWMSFTPVALTSSGKVSQLRFSYFETGPAHMLPNGNANPFQEARVVYREYERQVEYDHVAR